MKGNFYENERVALFIDGANLYSAARALGFDIDYRRLLKAVSYTHLTLPTNREV